MAGEHGGGTSTGFYVVVVLAALLLVVFVLFMIGAFSRAPPETQSPDIPVRFDTPAAAPGGM